MAIFGVVAYMNFGDIGYPRVYHRWDFFHYYIGSKYSNELGYEGIYAATAIAESELGPEHAAEVRRRSIRNLATDTVEPASVVLASPAPYKGAFSATRWEAFKNDVAWFRAQCNASWWRDMQVDHGFNPSPVWTMVGGRLASLAPASDHFLRILSALDLVLFGVLFGAIMMVFGNEVAAVTVLFWGTQWPADFVFTWGGFLRQDWLCAVILAACCAKSGRHRWAGVLVAYAAVVRVFPALLAVGVVVAAAWHWRRSRSVRPDHGAFLKGFFHGAVTLSLLAGVAVGPSSLPAFQHHIRAHARTPATNLMGLKTAVVFDYAERVEALLDTQKADPFSAWKSARAARSVARAPIFAALALSACAFLVLAMRRPQELWVTLAQSAVLLPILLESTNYYYSFLLLLPLLSALSTRFAVLSLSVAAASAAQLVWTRTAASLDVRCVVQSVLILGFGLAAAALVSRTRGHVPVHVVQCERA
jgi:hypothetical protein